VPGAPGGAEKRDGNTEFTEIGAQRTQRTAQSREKKIEKRKNEPRTQVKNRTWGTRQAFMKQLIECHDGSCIVIGTFLRYSSS
jgi:hypothetical protein